MSSALLKSGCNYKQTPNTLTDDDDDDDAMVAATTMTILLLLLSSVFISIMNQLAKVVLVRRLSFFCHVCHADTSQGHSRAVQACTRGLPKTGDAEPVEGRSRQTQLRTVEDDLQILRPLNFGWQGGAFETDCCGD